MRRHVGAVVIAGKGIDHVVTDRVVVGRGVGRIFIFIYFVAITVAAGATAHNSAADAEDHADPAEMKGLGDLMSQKIMQKLDLENLFL